MTLSTKRILLSGVCLMVLASITMRFVFHLSPMINVSSSEPEGLYLLDTSTSQKISRGDLVTSCIPLSYARLAFERDYLAASSTCPGHVIPVLKRVYGLPGDSVDLRESGVFVNGQKIPHSGRLKVDTKNNPIPHSSFHGKLSGYLLLAPTYHLSFDGRYFGPVSRQEILGRVFPLLVLRRTL